MTVESVANFATTALTTNVTLGQGSGTTFGVTGGQGALFPASTFYVTIDSEILLITSRATDTFTISARAQDGTTATSHSIGATVQQAIIARNLTHLWQNVADTFTPSVPPVQLGISASATDNEFESAGGWTLYPSPAGSTTFNAGSTLRSQLLMNRFNPDNALYTAYIAYTSGGAMTATIRLSEATDYVRTSGDQAQVSFFVSDQTNPTAGADTGNRFKLNTAVGTNLSGGPVASNSRLVRTVRDTSGAASFIGSSVPVSPGMPLWLRMTYDGSGNYNSYFSGDGLVYSRIGSVFISGGINHQSLGIQFHVFNPSGQWVGQTCAVDYLRLVSASPVGVYG